MRCDCGGSVCGKKKLISNPVMVNRMSRMSVICAISLCLNVQYYCAINKRCAGGVSLTKFNEAVYVYKACVNSEVCVCVL